MEDKDSAPIQLNEQDMEILAINTIENEPTSETPNEYASYKEAQEKDEDIQWIKRLILEHQDKKQVVNEF